MANPYRVGDRVVIKNGRGLVYSIGRISSVDCYLYRDRNFAGTHSFWNLEKAPPIPGQGGKGESKPPDRLTLLTAEAARLRERLAEVEAELSDLMMNAP